MSVLHWQLPSSSSPFSREAKARHKGSAASWQGPLLGKQTHINLLYKTSAVLQGTFEHGFRSCDDFLQDKISTEQWNLLIQHPANRDNICCLHMAASSPCSCIPLHGLSLLHIFPFCLWPLLFQAFSSYRSPVPSARLWCKLHWGPVTSGDWELGEGGRKPVRRWAVGGGAPSTRTLGFFRNSRPWNSTVQVP